MRDLLDVVRLGLRVLKRPRVAAKGVVSNPLWPVQSVYYLVKLRRFEMDRLAFVRHLFPEVDDAMIANCFQEIDGGVDLEARSVFGVRQPEGGSLTLGEAAVLYTVVRLLNPECVVETGPGSGLSSTCILAAMERSDKGHLYSVDLPEPAVAAKPRPDSRPGWLVPASLRARWTLIEGESSVRLVPLLEQLSGIDLFFHDSLHYFYYQAWEYEVAWPFIRPAGMLLTHDINRPYYSLSKKLSATPAKYQSLGGIRRGRRR